MLDPVQLLEMTIYSKLISEFSSVILNDIRIISLVGIVYLLYKNIPESYYTTFLYYLKESSDSFIIIPSHKKSYHISGYNTKEIIKMKYSHRFKALHHFLLHTCNIPFTQLYEIMEITDKCKEYSHSELEEYILMPYQNQKIKICPDRNIYLEITVSTESSDDNGDKQKKMSQSYKQYLCKLSTPGNNPSVLHDFLNQCITEHNEYLSKTATKQCIFEYLTTEYDDNDKKVAKYVETPFHSNKHLTKNIFFPEKKQFMEQLDKFVHNKEKHQFEYEESGQTYKLTVVLYGEPGTGKTCVVRGMLNYTGRDAVLVPWSKIKTCGDLSSILRTSNFNGKKKELKDLIFIFEDFDANNNNVLKTRKQKKAKKIYKSSEDFESENGEYEDITSLTNKLNDSANESNTPKEILEQIKLLKEYAANTMSVMTKPIDDELTLEYVLNMFDGIVEQHDAIIVFTTNHLEEIDPAAIRPGRVDYMLELRNATVETIKEMVAYKFKLSKEELCGYNKYYDGIVNNSLSPAIVQNLCFKYKKENLDKLHEELINKSKSKSRDNRLMSGRMD
jgi:hypothetical protein